MHPAHSFSFYAVDYTDSWRSHHSSGIDNYSLNATAPQTGQLSDAREVQQIEPSGAHEYVPAGGGGMQLPGACSSLQRPALVQSAGFDVC
jgi:hypothetical protein